MSERRQPVRDFVLLSGGLLDEHIDASGVISTVMSNDADMSRVADGVMRESGPIADMGGIEETTMPSQLAVAELEGRIMRIATMELENQLLQRKHRRSESKQDDNIIADNLTKQLDMAAADHVIANIATPFMPTFACHACSPPTVSAQGRLTDTGVGIAVKIKNELDAEGKKLTSGYEIKNQQTIRLREVIFWPHAFLSDMSAITDTQPDKLSIEAFVLGFMRILSDKEISNSEKSCRIEHLQTLMRFSLLHGFSYARDYHYSVLRALELGNLVWADRSGIEGMAWAALQRVNPEKSSSENKQPKLSDVAPASGKDQKVSNMICWSYNHEKIENGDCRFSKGENVCKKLHACDLCAGKGFFHQHKSKYDCTKSYEKTFTVVDR